MVDFGIEKEPFYHFSETSVVEDDQNNLAYVDVSSVHLDIYFIRKILRFNNTILIVKYMAKLIYVLLIMIRVVLKQSRWQFNLSIPDNSF